MIFQVFRIYFEQIQFSSVQLLSHVWLFVTPWTAARQASLSITNSWSLLKLISIELVMPFNHLVLCRPLLLLPSIFPNIRVFSNESALHIRWLKYWNFSFNFSPSTWHTECIQTFKGNTAPLRLYSWLILRLETHQLQTSSSQTLTFVRIIWRAY